VAISLSESNFNSLLNLVRLRLPRTKPNSWDLVTGIQSVRLSGSQGL
jgi:hypothetical protein